MLFMELYSKFTDEGKEFFLDMWHNVSNAADYLRENRNISSGMYYFIKDKIDYMLSK